MGKFDGILLVTDYDDTLVDRQKRVPGRSLAALSEFVAEGGRFTIASGRGLEAIGQCLNGLPINAPVICANGTQIYDFQAGQLLDQALLPARARADFAQVLAAFPRLAVEVYAQGRLYCYRPNAVTREHLRITGQTAQEAPLETLPEGWVYGKFQEDTPYLQMVQDYLQHHFPGRYTVSFSNPYLLEVGAQGKGQGVQRLAQLLGIAPDRVYCAGDNENDLSMLELAALGFTPAGSSPTALATADVVVCDCDQGALADVVAYLDSLVSQN
jgi:hypothetical protein